MVRKKNNKGIIASIKDSIPAVYDSSCNITLEDTKQLKDQLMNCKQPRIHIKATSRNDEYYELSGGAIGLIKKDTWDKMKHKK